MPRPTSGTTLQRPDLGALAYECLTSASQGGFIGLSLLPVFPAKRQSADYPKIPIEALLKMKDVSRGPRGDYNRSDYEFETGTYACKERGWEERVDDVEAAMYNNYFDAEIVAVDRSMDTILRAQEKRVADMLFNTGNLGNTGVSIEWSTAASATPKHDVVITGKGNMKAASGLVPNALAMGITAFNNLMLTAEVKDAFKYTNPVDIGTIEEQAKVAARYFGVEQVLIGGAIYDSAKKGKSFTIADIWDDEYVLLCKIASARDLKDPGLGRTFLWEEDSPENVVVETYREEQTRSNIVRVRHNVDECFVFAGAGYLLSNITA